MAVIEGTNARVQHARQAATPERASLRAAERRPRRQAAAAPDAAREAAAAVGPRRSAVAAERRSPGAGGRNARHGAAIVGRVSPRLHRTAAPAASQVQEPRRRTNAAEPNPVREAAKAIRPTARNAAALRGIATHGLRGASRGAATLGVVSQRLRPAALAAPVATQGGVARALGRAGLAVGAAFVAADVVSSYRREGGFGPETRQVAGRGVGGIAGGVAGAKVGGALGAAIGTAILPGVGTVIGGFVGAVGGAFAGSAAGQWVGARVVDAGEWVADRAGDAVDAVGEAADAARDAVGDAAEAVGDAVNDAVSALNPFD